MAAKIAGAQRHRHQLEAAFNTWPIRDAPGRLVNFRFLEANPTFLRGFRIGADVSSSRAARAGGRTPDDASGPPVILPNTDCW